MQILMLGLYIYTLIIGHKSCNMLRIVNKWTLQNFVTNTVGFFYKKKSQQNNQT